MAYILDHENKPYLKYFEDIAAIPHGSYNEEAISNYIVEFAKEHGLWHMQDSANNVLIKKPAAPGYETHEPIILQGHMDMVCEKVAGSSHDFKKDPLQLYVEDGWLKARGTTLGGDDGVAVAYILAILADEELKHPALECVINTGEEAGVLGTQAFDVSTLSAKKFIGLDGCTEGTSTILTSGVIGGSFTKNIHLKKSTKVSALKLKIGGLNAGHAAGNIGKEQANAIKSLGRILYYIDREYDIDIIRLKGGSYRNAIAEECEAVIGIDENDEGGIERIFNKYAVLEKQLHKNTDTHMYLTLEKAPASSEAMADETKKALLRFIYMMPSGTLMRSVVYDWLPIASCNMGTVELKEAGERKYIEIEYLFRCVNTTHLEDVYNSGLLIGELNGFTFELQSKYSGYEIEPGSDFYNLYAEVYKDLSGKELEFETVHYGTDAGTYAERIPGLDIIVLSPILVDVHTPEERLNLASFDRAYQYLKEILRRS